MCNLRCYLDLKISCLNRFGKIKDIGTDIEISKKYQKQEFSSIINADGKSIIPGIY